MQKAAFIIALFFSASLAGCHSVKTISRGGHDIASPVDYTLIFYIHGDGDYLFHDGDGKAIRADEHALEKAESSALQAKNGEAFIFHHLPQKKILGLFPHNTNRLYHYRNGQLLNVLSYRIDSGQKNFFDAEAALFREFTSDDDPAAHRSFFFYFGHEIPLHPGHSYHLSRPEIPVHTESFISGVKEFIGESAAFDVLALSTCSNGTPQMMAAMNNVANVVLASPQNLHLSHLDTAQLLLLEENPAIPSAGLAEAIARNTYQRLAKSVRTGVTLSVYEVDKIQKFASRLNTHSETYIQKEHPNLFDDNSDCDTLPFWDGSDYTTGVKTFFKPAEFGRNSNKQSHSGWGCKGP